MANSTGWKDRGLAINDTLRAAIRRAGSSVLLQGAGVGAAFAAQVVLARVMGPHEYGTFAWVTAWMSAAVILARCGCDTVTLRYGAAYAADGRWGAFNSLLRFVGKRVMAASLLTSLSLFVLMNVFADDPSRQLVCVTAVACIWFPILATNTVRQAALLAVGRLARSLAPESLIRPLATAILVASAAQLGWRSACSAMVLAGSAAICAFVAAKYWLRTAVPPDQRHAEDVQDASLWPVAASGLLLVGAGYGVMTQVDVIVIGILASPGDAGVYYASRQISTVVLFGLVAIQIAMAPTMAVCHVQNRVQDLQRLVNVVAWCGVAFSLAAGVAIAVFGRQVLALFGSGFQDGLPALYVLVLAQAVNASGGPVGILATMTGNHSSAALAYACAVAVTVVLTPLLLREFGIMGAAIAVLTGTIVWTTWLNRRIFVRTGIIARPRLSSSIRRSGGDGSGLDRQGPDRR